MHPFPPTKPRPPRSRYGNGNASLSRPKRPVTPVPQRLDRLQWDSSYTITHTVATRRHPTDAFSDRPQTSRSYRKKVPWLDMLCSLENDFMNGDLLARDVLKRCFKCLQTMPKDTPANHTVRLCRLVLRIPYSRDMSACVKVVHAVFRCLFGLSQKSHNDSEVMSCVDHLLNAIKQPSRWMLADIGYIIGTIKNLSVDTTNRHTMIERNCVEILCALIKWATHNSALGSQLVLFLKECTDVLRNLATQKTSDSHFAHALSDVASLLYIEQCVADRMDQLHLNVCRILGHVSTRQALLPWFIGHPKVVLRLNEVFKIYPHDERICVRVAYILGNLTADHDVSRQVLGEHRAYDVLLQLISIYGDKDEESVTDSDVLIKLIRLLANLCINEEVGLRIARSEDIVVLFEVLNTATTDELVLNVMGALSNISFYHNNGCVLYEPQIRCRTVNAISSFLEASYGDELLTVVLRVLGNVCRDAEYRLLIADPSCSIRGDLTVLMSHPSFQVVHSAVGVIVNIAIDPKVSSFVTNTDWSVLIGIIDVIRRIHDELLSKNPNVPIIHLPDGDDDDDDESDDDGDNTNGDVLLASASVAHSVIGVCLKAILNIHSFMKLPNRLLRQLYCIVGKLPAPISHSSLVRKTLKIGRTST